MQYDGGTLDAADPRMNTILSAYTPTGGGLFTDADFADRVQWAGFAPCLGVAAA